MLTTSLSPVDAEEARLRALSEYHLLDTPQEEDFDRLAELAARLFNVPIALISLLGRDRQFFKARVGLDVCETDRDVSFCAHAIRQDDILVILNAALDPRFSTNPLVIGPPFIRFYAGKPLVAPGGKKVGTLCIIDTEPHSTFAEADRKNLADLAALVLDRMEMRRLDYAKEISNARFENIAATSPDAIICSTAEGAITFWNKSAERLFGYTAAEAGGRTSAMIVPEQFRSIYDDEMARLRRGEGMKLSGRTVELFASRRDGRIFPAEFSLSTWKEGNTIGIGAIVRDISERRHNEERLVRLASIDVLTDLPNRASWRACLTETLAMEKPATILLFDLDGFKEINDTLGHAAGDALLKEVAKRLQEICKGAIKIGRLGGDEFVALLPGNDKRQIRAIAKRLIASISKLSLIGGRRAKVGVSIGVAVAPDHGTSAEELLGAADLALYKAKATGKGRYEVFAPMLREVAVARRNFEQELRNAFEKGEFELYYQPQVSAQSGEVMGAEALLRWNHPQRGLLTPASFIEVLSEKPSAAAVGEWILNVACREASEWQRYHGSFRIGINLFGAQLRSGRLLTAVREALDASGLPATSLELEIVENILMRDDHSTLRLLHDLRDMGVGLAFDDYGTGYASLSLLKRFPVSRLKIDRSFIRDVNNDVEDAAVVNAIIYLGKSFGLGVVAEGVENDSQLAFLKKSDCKEAQGYLFGRPVSAEEFSRRFIGSMTSLPAVR